MKVISNMLTLGKLLPDGPSMDQRILFDLNSIFHFMDMDFSDDGVCLRGSRTYFSWTVHMDKVRKIWPILFQFIGSCRNVLETKYSLFKNVQITIWIFFLFQSFENEQKKKIEIALCDWLCKNKNSNRNT